jgi:thymidylate synthase (FAD)
MTTFEEMADNPNAVRVLDKGFVRLVDTLGSDNAIVQAARVSYGHGTKSVREDRGLIRYLMRMRHTSPFEMAVVKLHIKAPIFVFRQLIRHRTHAANEYSARYSIVPDEYYIPDVSDIAAQSTTNRQGRGDSVSNPDALAVQSLIREHSDNSYELYESLLAERPNFGVGLSASFEGIARETARMVLPVNFYSEIYWTQSLHNLFHLLSLRMDHHAQLEIRELANAIYQLVQPLFPLATEAFEDYVLGALSLSRMEFELLRSLTSSLNLSDTDKQRVLTPSAYLSTMVKDAGSLKDFGISVGMSERELRDFITKWDFKIE